MCVCFVIKFENIRITLLKCINKLKMYAKTLCYLQTFCYSTFGEINISSIIT